MNFKPLNLLLIVGGATSIYTGFRGDPSGGLNPLKWAGAALGNPLSSKRGPKAITDTVKNAGTSVAGTIAGVGAIVGGGVDFNYMSAKNKRMGNKVRRAIDRKFPTARYAGMCNCRHQRGSGSDPDSYSVHSVCGAVDYFGPVDEIARWANGPDGKALGIVFAIIDRPNPGDVHVQYVPNLPSDWHPPAGVPCD